MKLLTFLSLGFRLESQPVLQEKEYSSALGGTTAVINATHEHCRKWDSKVSILK
jgi:hypothetical protein